MLPLPPAVPSFEEPGPPFCSRLPSGHEDLWRPAPTPPWRPAPAQDCQGEPLQGELRMRPSPSPLAPLGLTCCLSFVALSPALAAADEEAQEDTSSVFVIRAAQVVVRPGEVLENTAILVRDGRIVRIAADLETPDGAVEVQGEVVCAGFIDPWSALGLDGSVLDDRSSDAATRTADGVDLFSNDHLRAEALRAGVTLARLQGGYRAAVGGLGAFVRLDPALDSASEAIVDDSAGLAMSLGLSLPGSMRFSRGSDGSLRMLSGDRAVDVFDRVEAVDRVAAAIETGRQYREREVEYRYELEEWQKAIDEKTLKLEKDFKKAKKSRKKDQDKAEDKGKEFKEKKYKEDKRPRAPKFNAEHAELARVAAGETPLVVEVHRASEIRNLLEATKGFTRLRLVIAGASESLSVAAELAERSVPVIVWPSLSGTSRPDELSASDLSLAGNLAAEGVTVLLGSGGRDAAAARDLPLLAALAVGHGLDPELAFKALTSLSAETFDLADRLGSVEIGKDADLLVLDAMPFHPGASVRYVFSGGRLAITPEN
jgi:imidazolonepropionase-like amidohydrolase